MVDEDKESSANNDEEEAEFLLSILLSLVGFLLPGATEEGMTALKDEPIRLQFSLSLGICSFFFISNYK